MASCLGAGDKEVGSIFEQRAPVLTVGLGVPDDGGRLLERFGREPWPWRQPKTKLHSCLCCRHWDFDQPSLSCWDPTFNDFGSAPEVAASSP